MVSGRFVNVYSGKDWVLGLLYRWLKEEGEGGIRRSGRGGAAVQVGGWTVAYSRTEGKGRGG